MSGQREGQSEHKWFEECALFDARRTGQRIEMRVNYARREVSLSIERHKEAGAEGESLVLSFDDAVHLGTHLVYVQRNLVERDGQL